MLNDTLVIFGGEFGRTPMAQGTGRDHHIKGFSMLAFGGGIKGGISHGATDELGYAAVEDVCPVHDLHATMLHLMGIEHKRLTYKFEIPGANGQGRTKEEALESLRGAIELILTDRREDGLRGLPPTVIRETVTIG
jgi:hypothetical protein